MDSPVRKKKNFIHKNPFSCVICRKAFARKVGLRTHIKKTNHSINKKWPDFLKSILPQEWSYNIINFSKFGLHYKLRFLLPNVVTVPQLHKWMQTYIELNKCVYTKVGRRKNRTGLTPYSEFYRCQHFHTKKNGKKRSKGTGCKSTITASIKCDYSSTPYYTVVSINFIHNHPIYSGDTLRYRKPSVLVEKVFQRMSEDGFSPAQALKNFMIHLEFQPANLYFTSVSDRTKCPDYNWVHHFFSKLSRKKRKLFTCAENVANLIRYSDQLNLEHGQHTCLCQNVDDIHFIVSIVTPLMKRTLADRVSSEIMYVESIGSVCRFGLKVYILFTEYNVTKIPVGILMVTHESQSVIEQAFRLFLMMISDDPSYFGGRGKDGPITILTDQSKIEMKVLKSVFPKATIIFHTFHLLQNVYNWLLSRKYHVSKEIDLNQLYSSIRALIFSKEEEILENNFHSILQMYSENPLLSSYVKHLYEKRCKWASCYRSTILRRGIDRNIVAERELQILKERILEHMKVQTSILLVNYFVVEFDDFFRKKLINSCVELHHNFFSREFVNNEDARSYTYGSFLGSENLFYVYNKIKKTKYIVNVDIGMCTCCIGVTGNTCKHQHIVINDLNDEPEGLQCTMIVEPNLDLYYMATGSTELTQSFFDSIQTTNIEDVVAPSVVETGTKNYSLVDHTLEENLDNHIVEEILIEVVDSKDEDECETVESSEKGEFLNELQNSFGNLIETLRGNESYYRDGIKSMYRELEKLTNAPDESILAGLNSFCTEEDV